MRRFFRIFGIAAIVAVIGLFATACPTENKPDPVTEYDVFFETYDGTKIDGQKVLAGEKLAPFDEPTKGTDRFDGWFKTTSWTEADRFDVDNDPVNENMTLHARWLTNHTVTFELLGGIVPGGWQRTRQVLTGEFALRPEVDPTTGAYSFIGWYTQQTGGVVFNFEAVPITQNITIWARWQHTVTFDLGQGNGDESTDPKQVPDEGTVQEPNDPSRTGYDFAGWYTESEDGEPFGFETVPITQDTTIWARWTIRQITVKFNVNPFDDPIGEAHKSPITNAPLEQTIDWGAQATRPSTDPQREPGYSFHSWYAHPTEGAASFPFSTQQIMPDEGVDEITIYARWIPRPAMVWDTGVSSEFSSTQLPRGLAYGSGWFVAVGDGGRILVSQDGKDWTNQSQAGITFGIEAITYTADDIFVIGGSGGNIASLRINPDGTFGDVTTFGPGTGAADSGFDSGQRVRGLAYGKAASEQTGYVIAVGDNGRVSSSAGSGLGSWVRRTTPNNFNVQLNDVAWAGGQNFVAVGNGGRMMRTHDNGSSWHPLEAGNSPGNSGFANNQNINAIAFGDRRLIAAGAGGDMAYSTDDGRNWAGVTASPPPSPQIPNNEFFSIAYGSGADGNNYWLVGMNNGMGRLSFNSNDEVEWRGIVDYHRADEGSAESENFNQIIRGITHDPTNNRFISVAGHQQNGLMKWGVSR